MALDWPRLARALARERELLARQGDARDFGAADAGEIKREAAPAAADIKHAIALFDHQLGGDMALLCELRFVERRGAVLEIGAGILQVVVEKEFVEPAVEIVMMRHIAACAHRRVGFENVLQTAAQGRQRLEPPDPFEIVDIAGK